MSSSSSSPSTASAAGPIAERKTTAAAKQELAPAEQKLAAAEQKLAAAEQKLAAAKQELAAAEQKLAAAEQKLAAAKKEGDASMIEIAKQGMITAQQGIDSCQKLVTLWTDQLVKLETAAFTASTPSEPLILAKLSNIEATLNEKKRLAVVLSDIDSSSFKLMLSSSGFALDASSEWGDDLTQRLNSTVPSSSPPAFKWTDQNEPDQKDRYIPYLRTHLQLSREAALIDIDAKKSFLNVLSDRRLLFDISGTTDVAVIHNGYITARMEEQGILAVIELKKKCDTKAARQTIGQLIAADVISTFSPLAVLTDLCDEWHFYWLEGRKIKHLSPDTTRLSNVRQYAFALLQLALAPGFVMGEQLVGANTVINSLPVTIGKRRKLSPVKEKRSSGEEQDSGVESDDESDMDEEDRLELKCRQVRRWARNTPWLRDICRTSRIGPLSQEASRSMFA